MKNKTTANYGNLAEGAGKKKKKKKIMCGIKCVEGEFLFQSQLVSICLGNLC